MKKSSFVLLILFVYTVSTNLYANTIPDLSGQEFQFAFKNPINDVFIDTKDMENEIILVNFWSATCSPCIDVTPSIIELFDKYKDKGVNFIGINMNSTKDDFIEYIKKNNILWPQYYEENDIWYKTAAMKWGISTIPMFVLVDKSGLIHINTLDYSILDSLIEQLIKG